MRVHITASEDVGKGVVGNEHAFNKMPAVITPPKFTPLIKAASAGGIVAVKTLLRQDRSDGEFLFETDHKGRTALDWAIKRGRQGVVGTLKKAMDDKLLRQAAAHAALNQRTELESIVRLNLRLRTLLKHAVRKSDVRQAARSVAAANFLRHDYNQAIATLRTCRHNQNGGATNATNLEGSLPLDESLYFVDLETEIGGTPLLLACGADNVNLAEELIRRGAAADHENKRGHTALTWACVCGNDRIVSMLLRFGADASKRGKLDGLTPLLHAARYGHARVLQVLVDRLFCEAQMSQYENPCPEGQQKLLESEMKTTPRDWLLDFETALKYLEPQSHLCARDLAASLGYDDAVAVLKTAELRCQARLAELEEERAKMETVACPRDCGSTHIERDSLTSHLLNDCDLRPAGCDFCGATLPLRELERHKSHDCPSRAFKCDTCGQHVPAISWRAHRQFRCPRRTVVCRQGCGLSLAADKLSNHELTRCKYRPKPCPVSGCSAEVPSCLLQRHVREECPHREVDCAVGCGMKIPFQEKEHHERSVCVQRCRWDGCSLAIGPIQRRQVHEKVQCGRRGVACKFMCGADDIAAETLDFHATFLCPNRVVLCPAGCGWKDAFKKVDQHIDSETGDCRERHMRCRYDMLGRRIEYRPNSDSADFERAVLRRYRPEDGRFLLFGARSPTRWASLVEITDVSILDNDNWVCGWVAAIDMPQHFRECSKVPYRADATRDVPTIAFDSSPYPGPSHGEVRFRQPNSADEDERLELQPAGQEQSISISSNAVIPTRCKYGCGAEFGTEDDGAYERHVLQECPKRPVQCVCGDESLWAEELDDHKAVCPVLTYVPLPPGKMCKCGEYVPNTDRATHMGTCEKRERYCPQGCGSKIVAKEISEHLLVCPRRFLRPGLFVPCPLGCGNSAMRFQHKWAHTTTECPRRVVACTLGCSKRLLSEQLEDHKPICPKRAIPCGAGAIGCQRALQSWILLAECDNTTEGRQMAFIACDVHNATALHFAIRSRDNALLDYLLNLIESTPDNELERESLDGHTALTKACEMDWIECVEKLWRAGANLNCETRRGRTPLIEAAKNGALATCRFLVDRGALIDYKSKHRTTAIDWAKMAGHIMTYRQLCRDLDVHQDMAHLFTLVTLGNADAIKVRVEPGESYRRGNLRKFVGELAIEDGALESASKSISALSNKVHDERLANSRAESILEKQRNAAHRMEAFADQVHTSTRELEQAVDAKLAISAKALQSFELPDLFELRSLSPNIVSPMMLLIIESCSEILSTASSCKDPPLELVKDAGAASFHRANRAKAAGSNGCVRKEEHAIRWQRAQKTFLKDTNLIQRLRHFSIKGIRDPAALARRIRKDFAMDRSLREFEYPTVPAQDDGDVIEALVVKAQQLAREVSCLQPPYSVDSTGSTNGSRLAIDGYEFAGILAAWVNGQVAALEASCVLTHLEHIEHTLRDKFERERAPALKSANQAAFRARNKLSMLLQELEQAQEEEAYRRRRVKAWEGKVRVARVLQKYTPGGHSLLTWACALGNKSVVEILLDHGACPGLPDDVESFAICVIQLLYRHHRWRQSVREKRSRQQQDPSASEVNATRLREAMFGFTLSRQLALYWDMRQRIRVPLCEAAYNGHDKIFETFQSRRLMQTMNRNLLVTACKPQPPFPFAKKSFNSSRLQRERRHATLSILECAKLGRHELPRQHWKYGQAWIAANDPSAPPERTALIASAVWSMYARAQLLGARKQDNRLKHRTRKDRRNAAIQELLNAMYGGDFNRVSQIFDNGIVPVDHEDAAGTTPLIAAASEDTAAVESRIQSYDVEDKPVLAVVLLLDRRSRRPNVNAENRRGETALAVACVKGHLDVAAALLERGALIDFQSTKARVGWTPLRWTVELSDRPETIDFLVERGAKLELKAQDGLDAYEAAIARDRMDAIAALARHQCHNIGQTCRALGAPQKEYACPYGCGLLVCLENQQEHCLECRKRPVTCDECGDTELWAEELEQHLKNTCPIARIVGCPLECGASFRIEFAERHSQVCKNRVELCYMCGVDVRQTRMKTHQAYFCPMRHIPKKVKPKRVKVHRCSLCNQYVPETHLEPPHKHKCPIIACVDCPNRCGERPSARELPAHLGTTCRNRWERCERCGLKIRVGDMKRHLSDDAPTLVRCKLSSMACNYQCGRNIPIGQMDIHKAFECPKRPVPCALCGVEIEYAQSRTHKDNECPIRTVECPNRSCYLRLPLANMKRHALLDCKKRVVSCLLGCGERLLVKNLAKHRTARCPLRYVDCPLGCTKRLRAQELGGHIERSCIRRTTESHARRANGIGIPHQRE